MHFQNIVQEVEVMLEAEYPYAVEGYLKFYVRLGHF